MATDTFVITLSKSECSQCHGIFAVSSKWQAERRRDHRSFHCPYCGTSQYFPGESDIDRANRLAREAQERLVRERASADQRQARLREERDAARNQVRAQKAAKTKLKKRIAAGMCPCCQRPFANLMRHMQHQHPQFIEDEATT